jgi:putative acetyltransferase
MLNSTPALAPMNSQSPLRDIEFRALLPHEDATGFRRLNEEWITRYFVLEPKDVETLSDPGNTIFRKSGRILMAYANAEPVGCAALIPMGDGVVELAKMAVAPECRGRGIGRRLLEYAIEQARTMGAKSVFLGSSTKLPAAVHLYETVGFRHVDPDSLGPMPYARADVFMQLSL